MVNTTQNPQSTADEEIRKPNYQFIRSPEGTQTVEIELPGVKKSDMEVSIDANSRTLTVIGKRFNVVRSNNNGSPILIRPINNGNNNQNESPLVVYKWQGIVHGKADLTKVEAEYYGDGIFRVSVKEAVGNHTAGSIQIEITDA